MMKTPLLLVALAFGTAAFTQTSDQAPVTVAVPNAAEEVRPLAVGSKVPAVNVRTMDGKTVSLSKLLSAQPTVLVFYRGGWCPYCNAQMSGLQSVEGDLKKLGYRIVAISPDRAEELKKSTIKQKLSYQLLSDAPMNAAKALGIAFKVNDETVAKYRGYGIDLETASGEKHHLLPVPSAFLVGADGTITYRYFNADYKVRLPPNELLAAARRNPAGKTTTKSAEKKGETARG